MKKPIHITQDEVLKKVKSDLQKALKPLESAPPGKIQKQAERIAQLVLSKAVKDIPDAEPIELTSYIKGKNVVFQGLNMTTVAALEGLDIRSKNIVESDQFLFWHFDQGTIRKDKNDGSIVLISAVITKQVSEEFLNSLKTASDPGPVICAYCKTALMKGESYPSDYDPSDLLCYQCHENLKQII